MKVTIDNGLMTNGTETFNVGTAIELQHRLGGFDLKCEGMIKCDYVEDMNFPFSMTERFYNLFFKVKNIPTQKDFVDGCMDDKVFLDLFDTDERMSGLIGRLSRTYPSLIRDYHFYLMCNDSKFFENVLYDSYDDMCNRADVKLKYAGQIFNIQLFLDTKNSKKWRSQKNEKYDNANNYIEFPLVRSRRIGFFNLYTAESPWLLKGILEDKTTVIESAFELLVKRDAT